jgi:uncharacterized protein involved in outer membrane biogenesis
MWGRVVKIALSLPSLIVAGLFALYLAFGFFLVNPLAQKLLPWVGENKLDSQLSAQQVKFNPLTLEATVEGLKLAEKSGAPLATFERLYVNLDTTGLFRWAWRIRDIQIDQPHAIVEVRRGGKLNWAELIARLREDQEPPSDVIARVLIDRIRIDKGHFTYIDANRVGKPFIVGLEPLGIELDGLSTLPEDRGDYLIAARLPEQGGTLKWKGDVGLNPVTSSGEVGLEGVRLTNLLRVIKSPRNFELPTGTLAAGLRYRFAMVQDKTGENVPWLQVNGANLLVQNLALVPRGGDALKDSFQYPLEGYSDPLRAEARAEPYAPVLQLTEARVSNASLDLAKREIQVAGVSLVGGKFAATRDVKGMLDWQTLFAVSGNGVAPKPPNPKTVAPIAPWKIGVREIKLADWAASFTDQGFATPLGLAAEGFALTGALTAEVGDTTAIDIGPVNAELGPVRLLSGAQRVAELQRATLVNAGMKLAEKRLVIDAVELNGAKTTMTLDKHKTLNWLDILKKAPGAPETPPAKAEAATASPIDLQLSRLSLDDFEIDIVDQSPNMPVRLGVAKGFVILKDLSLDMNKAVPLEAGFAVNQGGRFDASGTVIPGKASGRLDLKLAGLSLQPFAPYVNQFARLNLHSGVASTRGKLTFARGKSGMKLDYGGGFTVDDLAITEEETEEAFLGWKRLSSNSLDVKLGPNRLHINELVALNPFGKVIIFEDKSINLQRILRTSASDKPAAKPETSTQAAAFPLAIERLRIVGANVEFADFSLTPQFGTRMYDLGGVVTGLSNDPATMALVELDGKVDDFGSARIRGSIQPFRATDFTDLNLTFRNLEMTNLTPYSGKFAGRKIDSGKLSVDLEYKIKQRQLGGDNKFVITRLQLGERVDSPNAIKLPLDLAIALLEDSNGIIDLDLPVTGSLDDPQFSYGKIIWKAIVNVLTRLVTAPFRALGKLLGVSSEKLEAIDFDPGSSALMPPEQEKLKILAEAMAKRPALTLTLEPGYDPKADRRALQELALRHEAGTVAGIELAPGEAPGPVDVNNYAIQTWLEDRYAERVGKAEYQKLRASFRNKDADAVARMMESELIERIGRRFKTRDTGPASTFHTELLERLTQQTTVGDDALVRLAEARGQAMRDALVGRGFDSGRVSIAAPAQQTAKDHLVGSKMSLGVGKKPAVETAPAAVAP